MIVCSIVLSGGWRVKICIPSHEIIMSPSDWKILQWDEKFKKAISLNFEISLFFGDENVYI